MRTARYLYQAAMASSLALAAPYLLVRRGSHYLETLPGRLGFAAGNGGRDPVRGGLWIHAVSVGEVGVAATLAAALPQSLPLVVTTVTPTGQKRAREVFGADGRRTAVAYLPFDLGFAVGPFYRRTRPSSSGRGAGRGVSNLRLPVTRMRSGGAPERVSRRRSSSLWTP